MHEDKQLVVLARYDSRFAIQFLNQLKCAGVRPSLIVVAKTSLKQRFKMFRFLARKIGVLDALRYNIKFLTPLVKRAVSFGFSAKLPDFTAFGSEVFFCKNINALSVVNKLKSEQYQKIILAQSGIIREGILSLENKWIVNVHPGQLPFYRGVDVVKWALFNQDLVEVTLHIVRKGVDTGEVLLSQPVSVESDDKVEDIERKATTLSIDLLVEAALKGPNHYGKGAYQDLSLGHQYYLMSFKNLRKLNLRWEANRDIYVSEAS
ncbi:MAG: formyltransferase family protein [Legionellaceae bacterium]|nr:formyltransferase family protein [Legionellaceae bacterium]